MESQIDNSVKLHYIDKLHTLQIESGKAINRYCALTLALCLLSVVVASGMVSVSPELSILGVKVTLPSWGLPFTGAWAILLTYAQMLGTLRHEERLRDIILELYQDIGFEHESLKSLEVNPLEYPNILTLIVSNENLRLGVVWIPLTLGVGLVVLLSPLAAEIYIAYKMVATVGFTWWIVLSFILILAAMAMYLFGFIRSYKTAT